MPATLIKTQCPARTVLAVFSAQYPIFNKHLPLAIGINKQLSQLHPEISGKKFIAALRHHTASTSYLKAMEKAIHRLDFEGKQAGEVTEEQVELAEKQKAEKLGLFLEKFSSQYS
ncbi:MAG TPA: ProQ/FinO family protein [Rhodocyclaceae bacterium]|jgi:ProP effector